MHKHPPPISGGYWRRLKKKESTKGFTLVELIVVIVILAILAAILIPGLLKWIDQAKDKKYELEAREIALAADAALTKVYAEGSVEVTESHYLGDLYYSLATTSNSNFMKLDAFKQEIKKLTDTDVRDVQFRGKGWNASEYNKDTRPWDGSVTGFSIFFVSSDGTKINAYYQGPPEIYWDDDAYRYPTDGWVIIKDPEYWYNR